MKMVTPTPQSPSSQPYSLQEQRRLEPEVRMAALQRFGLDNDPGEIQDKVSDELIRRFLQFDRGQESVRESEPGSIQELLHDFRRELMIDSLAVTVSPTNVPEDLNLLALSFHPEQVGEREEFFNQIHAEIEKVLSSYQRSDFFFGERSFGTSAARIAPEELTAIGAIARLEGVRRLS